jgi:hypothetical protein
MLNEAYDLWKACKRADVDLPIRIPGLDEGQNADGIRLFLGESGAVMRTERVGAQQMKRLRKWSCGSGITLPVFNFEPLHQLDAAEYAVAKKAVKELDTKGKATDLTRFLRISGGIAEPLAVRWPKGKTAMLDSAFKKVSADLLGKIGQDDGSEGDGWRKLLRTVQKLNAKEWLEELSSTLRQIAREHCSPLLFNLLFHDSVKAKAGTVPVHFEMEGANTPVYSERAQNWLIDVLARSVVPASAQESEGEEAGSAGENAAEGRAVWGAPQGSSRKYGQVKLPVLGNVRLFDRNVSEKPTSIRYDKERAIFRAGPDVRMKMMAAVEWLTAEERRGRTWAVRDKPKKDSFFLLLAYLAESVGSTPEHLTEIFAGPEEKEEESDQAIVKFETVCTAVVQTLDGIPGLSSAARIQVFALHKPDGYRAQIFASESFTQNALRRLAESWQQDCRAHPPIELPQFAQDGDATPVSFEPLVPFPYQAIGCLNTIWEKCGKANDAKCESASDYDLADAFELLRRTGSDPTDALYLERMLDLAARRALPLMGAVGQAMHQAKPARQTLKDPRPFVAKGSALKSRLQARHWPCLLSLLLARLGHKLEAFMKEPAYLIGRFLAELDRLHAYYAKHVSGKEDGLRQLLGNSLMSTALESPLRALDLAGQRMLPYQAWGYSFARGRKSKDALVGASDQARATNSDRWNVHYVLENLGRIAEDLSNCGIPEGNRAALPTRVGHEAQAPTKPVLDLTDTLRANNQRWMHSDAAAKAQMLLGYLARPERVGPGGDSKAGASAPPDFPAGQTSETSALQIDQ